MSGNDNNALGASLKHGRQTTKISLFNRLIELAHKAHDDSPTSAAVLLTLLTVSNIGTFAGFDRAMEWAGLPRPACQGVAFGMLLLALIPSFMIMRVMLRRQSSWVPMRGTVTGKPLDWDKPPEKASKSAEKNHPLGALPPQEKPLGLVPKQPAKNKRGSQGKKAGRGG
ncbi:hypothetical protein ACFYS8_17550 [Kitasatospora sp. NPDC004615]|uniref:hypothetical protein n=1 Tax=Kitasatospora sp. NPDC004615 TaxID=3364017 RepID=UPI0036B43110